MSCIPPFPSNCHINPICIEDFIVLKTKFDNVLAVLNAGEIKDINPIEQVGFDGFWNNSVPFWCKPQILWSDRCGTFHVLVFDLGLKNKCAIIPHIEFPLLCIDESFEVTNLTKFWETMVSKFYDPYEGAYMLAIFLFGPWGSFDYAKVVVKYVHEDGISFNVLEVEVWSYKPVSPFHDLSYSSIEDSD